MNTTNASITAKLIAYFFFVILVGWSAFRNITLTPTTEGVIGALTIGGLVLTTITVTTACDVAEKPGKGLRTFMFIALGMCGISMIVALIFSVANQTETSVTFDFTLATLIILGVCIWRARSSMRASSAEPEPARKQVPEPATSRA
ncbi:hypothetical protein [Corynebacterium cystitidis]|uniref:hypothetical protein n=1 Tax=Corynebacterium cystitidis TaxID=35757 RepID=UPI00211F229F|nr:hypothetical protein [Corynebacterium cystitidis]